MFYRPYLGFEFGKFLRKFGQWYVTVFFVLAISVFVTDAGTRIRSVVGDKR